MAFPILTEADLPPIDTTCERSDIDFKEAAPINPCIEHAKDVAALANTIGGAIIVGAATAGMVVASYPGVSSAVAAKLPDAYEQSAKDRCRPAPRIASEVIPLKGGSTAAVVINVWPSPLAPVGVHVRQQIKGAKFIAEAWTFPFRVGSHTRCMQPDQFGSLENVSARRAAALLLGIPEEQRNAIQLRWMRPSLRESNTPYSKHDLRGELVDVLLDQNVAVFSLGEPPGGRRELRLPLDWIDTIWRDEQIKAWVVFSSAVIDQEGGRYVALKVTF
jgi:hypothetical protein